MPQGPPDKLSVLDLSTFTTAATRANAISNAIVTFNTDYGVYPNYVLIDDTVNAAYIGYYA